MLAYFGLLFPALHSWSVPSFSTLQALLLASESLEVEVQVKSVAVAGVQLQQPEQFEPVKENISVYIYTLICNCSYATVQQKTPSNSTLPLAPGYKPFATLLSNKKLIQGTQLCCLTWIGAHETAFISPRTLLVWMDISITPLANPHNLQFNAFRSPAQHHKRPNSHKLFLLQYH